MVDTNLHIDYRDEYLEIYSTYTKYIIEDLVKVLGDRFKGYYSSIAVLERRK